MRARVWAAQDLGVNSTSAGSCTSHGAKRVDTRWLPKLPRFLSFVASSLLLYSCLAYAQPKEQSPEPEIVKIPVKGYSLLGTIDMVTEVFKPGGPGPFPVLLFSHGRAGTPVERTQLSVPIARGHVSYWLKKGFAVVAPIRPGYGSTGGWDLEFSGAKFDQWGNCSAVPDYSHAADAAKSSLRTALDWVQQQSWAKPGAVVLEGLSMGGLATVALAADDPPGIAGYINFSGGVGGNPALAPGKSCGPEEMRKVMGEFGKTTRVPSLWLYAENDLYWGPDAPRNWHAAFAAAGSPTTFVMTTPVPDPDGHRLLLRGGRLWSVHTDAFIRQLGF